MDSLIKDKFDSEHKLDVEHVENVDHDWRGRLTTSTPRLSGGKSLASGNYGADEMTSSQSTNMSASPRPPISSMEAKHYYYGLFSKPVLVARSGTDSWEPPADSYLRSKELRPVGHHPLAAVWEGDLAYKIHKILEAKEVKWTSTDVPRIGFVGEPIAPVVIWIGVEPNSLSREDGLAVAVECKKLLMANKILDVEVEIRESLVTPFAGPKLQAPRRTFDTDAELWESLASTLGLSISNTGTPYAEGTGGFYVTDNKSMLYLVTARHVVLNLDVAKNEKYECKIPSEPRQKIALFGTSAFDNYVIRIKTAIRDMDIVVDFEQRRVHNTQAVAARGAMDAEEAASQQRTGEKLVKEARDEIAGLQTLLREVEQRWSNLADRVLGHIRFSPALELGVGPKAHTQDYALIELDRSKIDEAGFTGNAIDLGTKLTPLQFTCLMFPHPENSHSFKYPIDRLLKFQSIIPDQEMRHPTIYNQNKEPCLIVIKRGHTTGLTIGQANTISSYVRNYYGGAITGTSMEWAIFSYDKKSGPFSEKGDSGSAIVDCFGRLGGLLTSGSGSTDSTDVTYATPASFILDSLRANGYNVTLDTTRPPLPRLHC